MERKNLEARFNGAGLLIYGNNWQKKQAEILAYAKNGLSGSSWRNDIGTVDISEIDDKHLKHSIEQMLKKLGSVLSELWQETEAQESQPALLIQGGAAQGYEVE